MLQIAIGGYYLASDGVDQFYDNPVYYEPGFRPITTLELSIPKSDRIYILLRKRADATETSFFSLSTNNFTSICKDSTNGETVPSSINANMIHGDWNSSSPSFTPLVLYLDSGIDITNPTNRVRSIDCCIVDDSDNSFISFRIFVSDDNLYFYYIPITINKINERDKYTAVGSECYMKVSDSSDSYLLFSPFAYLKETTKENGEFSYPLNSIFYERKETYNNEDFSFSLGAVSNNFVLDEISLFNVPNYNKAAVLHVDSNMYKKLQEENSISYVYISVSGLISGISENFKINFMR